MPKNRKKSKYWKERTSHGLVKSLLSMCLIVMILSQLCLTFNRFQIKWHEQKVTNVTVDSSSDLIIATDMEKSRAGAMNYEGETVIPFENSIFDPWTGELISEGLYHEGNLYWVNQDGRVGIVNNENKEIIPREYGFLKRGLENQFIAGTGTLSEVVSDGGQYIQKKYGIVAEGNEIIIAPEYDELSVSEDGTYYGIIYEDTRTIRRTLKPDGTLKDERSEPVETETEEETESSAEPSSETSRQTEESGQEETKTEDGSSQSEPDTEGETTAGGEEPDIQDYDGGEESYTIQDKYNDKKERSIHYHNGAVTLELLDRSTVLAEFPGIRTPDVDEPVFSEDENLVIDNWEDRYDIYSAKDGQLLCSVAVQTDYQYAGTLLAYKNDGMYEVKNLNNQVLFSIEAGSDDRFMNSELEKPRFVFQEEYFVYQGENGRTLITNQGVVIAEELDTIYYNYENIKETEKEQKIFICEKDGKFGAFSFSGEKILDFIYDNVEFFEGQEKALRITDEEGKVGIADYEGNLIIPIEYDNVGYGANIQGADSRLIETYTLLHGEEESNRYFGQKGNEIYYLDENGEIANRVQYVAKQEQSGGGLSDLLAFKKQMENRIVYRMTGYQKVMCNAFGTGPTYRRSQVEVKLDSKGITFLCIDTVGGQVGIYEYTYGAFNLMGYQQNLYDIWLVSSRLFFLLLFFYFLSGISYHELFGEMKDSMGEWKDSMEEMKDSVKEWKDSMKEWGQKHGKKK